MAISRYAAFAGEHCRPQDSRYFIVAYFDRAALRGFNRVPPSHADYRKVGWYWYSFLAGPDHGPFTSSRQAYHAAMAWKPAKAKAAA